MAEAATKVGQILFVRHEDSAFPCRNILGNLKTERAAPAQRAGAATVALASPSVGGVFKHCQVVFFGQLIDSFHVGRAAADMDWNDSPRARGELPCHILRIEAES